MKFEWQATYEHCLAKYNGEYESITSIVLDEQCNIIFCSKGLLVMMGFSETPLGENLSKYISADSFERLRSSVSESKIILSFWENPSLHNKIFVVFRHANWIILFGDCKDSTNNRILEVFGSINIDMANITRELNKKNEVLEAEITERKRLEEVLRESEERYRSLMMQSQDAIVLIDMETLKIVDVNPKFEMMTGYKRPYANTMNVFDLFDDSQVNMLRYLDQLHNTSVLPPTIRRIKTQNGQRLQVERTGTLVSMGGRQYQLITFRDVTEKMERQREMQRDLILAAQVQRTLLPVMPRSRYFQIQTLFRPHGFVSGDVYYTEWREEERALRGFLIDITGHGMATALQTAAANVLLHEVMDLPEKPSVSEQLIWLNQRISRYIDETSFAAAIAFEMDFIAGELRYSAAGISEFLFNTDRISAPGMFLGINEKEQYEIIRRDLLKGDSVCFMTDGITDVLNSNQMWGTVHAEKICSLFNEEKQAAKLKDDAAAICIKVMDPTQRKEKNGWLR